MNQTANGIQYREFGAELALEAYEIYKANKWESYFGDMSRLTAAFERSLYLLGAFEGRRLVGFVRCVGDGEFILYVQDLIIAPSHQRRGIGRELMRRASEKYAGVRLFTLLTDRDNTAANEFYRSIGLTTDFNGWPLVHYLRSAKTV